MKLIMFLFVIPLIVYAQSDQLGINTKGGFSVNGGVIFGLNLTYDLKLVDRLSWSSQIGNYYHSDITGNYFLTLASGAKIFFGELKPSGVVYSKLQIVIAPVRESDILNYGYGIGLTLGYEFPLQDDKISVGLNGELINVYNISNFGILFGYTFAL